MTNTKHRQLTVQAAIDLFGYAESDFDDMTYEDIMGYLLESQLEQIERYLDRTAGQ